MKKRITISELKSLIKEEVQKFNRRALLENDNAKGNFKRPKWLEDLAQNSFNLEDELRKSYEAFKKINPEEFKDFDIEALIASERKKRFNDPNYDSEGDYADEEDQKSLENDDLYDMGIDPINENMKKQITISKLRQIIRESIESLDKKIIAEGEKNGIQKGDYILVHRNPYEVLSSQYMERVPDGNPDDGFSPEWYYKVKDADGKIWKMKAEQLHQGLKKYLSKEEFESISAERREEEKQKEIEDKKNAAERDARWRAERQAKIDAETQANIDADNKYKNLPLVPNDIKKEFYFEFGENVYDFGVEDLGRDDLVMEVFSESFETENDYVKLKAVVTLDTELGHDTIFNRRTGKFDWLEIGYSNEKIVKLTFVDANTGEDKYRLDEELTKKVEGDIYNCLDYIEEDFRKEAKGWTSY